MNCPHCQSEPDLTFKDFWTCGVYCIHPNLRTQACCEIENDLLRERITQLVEAGDCWIPKDKDAQNAWHKVKGEKPHYWLPRDHDTEKAWHKAKEEKT